MPKVERKSPTLPVTAAKAMSSYQTEHDMIWKAVDTKKSGWETSLLRMSKKATKVVYLKKCISGQANDQMIYAAPLSKIDPDTVMFDRIDNFLLVMAEDSFEQNEGDAARVFDTSGEIIILPNTLVPEVGDVFFYKEWNDTHLGQITDIQKTDHEDSYAYNCKYQVIERNFIFENSSYAKLIRNKLIFHYENIGTSYRSIFNQYEDTVITSLTKMHNEFMRFYYNSFMDPILNTFLLTIKEAISDPHISFVADGKYPDLTADRNTYVGAAIYDRELVEFINKNMIFGYPDGIITAPSTFFPSTRNTYYGTIFAALETRSYKTIKKGYHNVQYVSYGSTQIHRMLYGKGDCHHVESIELGSLTLYPPGFAKMMKMNIDETDTYKTKDWKSVDFFVDLISLYINNASNSTIIDRLMWLLDNEHIISEFIGSAREEYQFYMIPMIAFVIDSILANLSVVNTSENI